MTGKEKQYLLGFLGYYAGDVDGLWGKLSEAAAADFRTDFGLAPGAEIGDALRHAVAYGMPARDIPDKNDGNVTGTFWDEIEYFTREEFACKCGQYHSPYCDGYPAEPKEAMVRIADRVRRELGVPVTVVSGLRCKQHNADSGGVVNSQHMAGEACDIQARNTTADALLDKVLSIPGVRYAYKINSTNVHFDIPKGG